MTSSSRSGRVLHFLLWLCLLAFAFSLGFQKIRTFDYWWHLRTGQLIVETGAVPKADPYTYTVPGARWIDIHWLHQLGLHGLHSLGGHEAVVVAKVVCVWAIVAVLATIGYRRERPWVTVLALALFLAIASPRFMPRPELPSFLFLAGVLALHERHTRRPDLWIYGVVAIQLLWVNLHGLFALGLAVSAIYFAVEVLQPVLVPGAAFRRREVRRLGSVLLLASGVSLVNPNVLDGALYPFQQFGMIGSAEDRDPFGFLISELRPTLATTGSMLLGFALALGGAAVLAMTVNWRRLHGAEPLLFVAFLYLGIAANRNLALFGLVAAPILIRNANAILDRWNVRGGRAPALVVILALSFLVWDVASDRFFQRTGGVREAGLGVFDPYFPVGSVDWIERERPPGPICHHMADGGYIGWRLFPGYRVMVDGRLEVYGVERFLSLQATTPERFRELDEEHRFGVVLVHFNLLESSRLMRWLRFNSNWRLTQVDETSAVFVRDADGRAPWPEIDIDAPDLFPPLPREGTLRDKMARQAQTNFYRIFERPQRALETWEAALAEYPDLPNGALLHATLLREAGQLAAAETLLRRLLVEDPRDAELHSGIGQMRLELGDLEEARAAFELALDADPELWSALLGLAQVAEFGGDHDTAVRFYGRLLLLRHPADPLAGLARERLLDLTGGGRP